MIFGLLCDARFIPLTIAMTLCDEMIAEALVAPTLLLRVAGRAQLGRASGRRPFICPERAAQRNDCAALDKL